MWVRNKDKTEIINFDHVQDVFLTSLKGGRGEVLARSTYIEEVCGNCTKYIKCITHTLGEYDEKRRAEFALRELFEALADEDQYFDMPSEREAKIGSCP